MQNRFTFALAASAIFALSSLFAEEVLIKPLENVPVAYRLEIEGNIVQKSKNGNRTVPLGTGKATANFNMEIISKKEGQDFPELVITPKELIIHKNFMGVSIGFDSTAIPSAHSPELKLFHDFWSTPIRFPLTRDPAILTAPSEVYPLLPMQEPQDYIEMVKHILTYLATGEHYKTDEILWDVNEESQFSDSKIRDDFKLITRGIVKEINPKTVTISAKIGLSNDKAPTNISEHTADVTAIGEFTLNINRSNALVRQLNGTAIIKLTEDQNNKGAPLLRDGDIDINLKFNLSSK